MSTFGQTLWSHVSSSIISSILHPNIPSSVSEFSKFNKLSQLSEQLEIRVKGMGVFSPPSQGETNHDLGKELSLYAGDVDMHFSIQKRTQLLVMAREVIMNGTWDTIPVDEAMKQSALSYFNSSEKGIQEKTNDLDEAKQLLKLKLFEYPKCAISKRVSKYQLFLTKSISEIVELNRFCATQLYFTTRDLIDLFRTSISVLYGKQISTVPQLAMLHHNDLLWLSHFIIGMGYRLKVKGELNFQYDDLVGILRREAEDVARRALVCPSLLWLLKIIIIFMPFFL
ncbi:RZZ complex, subunit Zw10 [Paraphysoderma sedebokerense]|nr:RZZ complex, subunit Zw10 [Paraphysoderma sedebokerense]